MDLLGLLPAWPSGRCQLPRRVRRPRTIARRAARRHTGGIERRKHGIELSAHHRQGLASIALGQGLADTKNRATSPARKAARTLAATRSSVSPNSARRSECPTITYWQPTSRSIAAETSPVKAPDSSAATSWAPSLRLEAATARRAPPDRRMAGRSAPRRGLSGLARTAGPRPAAARPSADGRHQGTVGRTGCRSASSCPRQVAAC